MDQGQALQDGVMMCMLAAGMERYSSEQRGGGRRGCFISFSVSLPSISH